MRRKKWVEEWERIRATPRRKPKEQEVTVTAISEAKFILSCIPEAQAQVLTSWIKKKQVPSVC